MARAKELVRFSDPLIEKQVKEIVKAVNSITLGPHPRDLAADGTPIDGARSAQADASFLSFESKGVGVALELQHGLGRIPCGFVEIAKTDAGGLIGFPNDQSINRAWTRDRVFLVPQTPKGTRHRVQIF